MVPIPRIGGDGDRRLTGDYCNLICSLFDVQRVASQFKGRFIKFAAPLPTESDGR